MNTHNVYTVPTLANSTGICISSVSSFKHCREVMSRRCFNLQFHNGLNQQLSLARSELHREIDLQIKRQSLVHRVTEIRCKRTGKGEGGKTAREERESKDSSDQITCFVPGISQL